MAKRAKHAKRVKRPAAQRWTAEERAAWVEFLQGRLMFPPGNRSLSVVVQQLRGWRGRGKKRGPDMMPSFDRLDSWTRHSASIMAVAWLSGIPHRRENQIKEQADAMCRIAAGDIAFMIEKSEEKNSRPEKMTLFEEVQEGPKRSAIFDMDEQTLHSGISHVRVEIARKLKARARKAG